MKLENNGENLFNILTTRLIEGLRNSCYGWRKSAELESRKLFPAASTCNVTLETLHPKISIYVLGAQFILPCCRQLVLEYNGHLISDSNPYNLCGRRLKPVAERDLF